MGIKGKAIGSIGSLCVDWVMSNGITLIVALIGGGGMTYLSSISAALNQYGFLAWIAVGLVTFVIIAFSFACFSFWEERRTLSDYTKKSFYSKTSNPLSPQHKNEKVNLIDFYHPYYKAIKNVRFEGCDLMGPVNLYVDGGTFDQCGFNDCEIVIVRSDRLIKGVVPMVRPVFLNCNIYRVTLLMPFDMYNTLPPEMKKGMPIISDGRIGDI